MIKRAAEHHEVMAVISKPKPKRRKMTERKKLVKRLDEVTREIVLKRDKFCVTCGKTENLQCGHLITRARYGVRWDLMNCNAQCSGCNLRHEYQPEIYTRWFLNHYGEKEYQSLCNRAETQGKFTIDELETILMCLEDDNE
jgi:5-methylcytosine-specific restriction endonuclease McrA